jgi:hypothetical protein
MKHALVLLSLTLGVAAAIKTAEMMNSAAEVLNSIN